MVDRGRLAMGRIDARGKRLAQLRQTLTGLGMGLERQREGGVAATACRQLMQHLGQRPYGL